MFFTMYGAFRRDFIEKNNQVAKNIKLLNNLKKKQINKTDRNDRRKTGRPRKTSGSHKGAHIV